LEQTVQDLEQQLGDQENEANEVILKWQEFNTTLETENAELKESLNKSKDFTDEQDSLASSQAQLAETESALTEAQKQATEKDGAFQESQGKEIISQSSILGNRVSQYADKHYDFARCSTCCRAGIHGQYSSSAASR
jgi:chromosome segregation ATPase